MVLHFETEDEYNQMIPVPIERYEHLLLVEALYDRTVDELLTDIKYSNKTYFRRHELLMMLGQTEEAVGMKRKEEEFENELKEFDARKFQRV